MNKLLNFRSTTTLSTLSSGILGLVLALGGTGCDAASSDNATMKSADYNQVASALTALVLDDNGQPRAFDSAAQIAKGIVPTNFHVTGEVALAEVRGSEYSLSAVCSDAVGRGADCGDGAAEAYVAATWSDDSADFDADWTLVDLDQDVMVLDGKATATAEVGADAYDADGWRLDYHARYAVGLDAETHRAVSGAIDFALTVERPSDDGSTFVAVDAHLAFAADGSATLTLDGNRIYQVNRDGSLR